jgi:hypothetical protein
MSSKFIGGYYINWRGSLQLTYLMDNNGHYLFYPGAVYYESPGDGFYEDCKKALLQGRRIILSVLL